MKIIGHVGNDVHLVEMTSRELALITGFTSPYGWQEEFSKALGDRAVTNRGRGVTVNVGTELNVVMPADFVRRFSEQEDKVKNSAGMLRALADMIENAVPSRSIPPIEDPDPDFAEVEEE